MAKKEDMRRRKTELIIKAIGLENIIITQQNIKKIEAEEKSRIKLGIKEKKIEKMEKTEKVEKKEKIEKMEKSEKTENAGIFGNLSADNIVEELTKISTVTRDKGTRCEYIVFH